MKLLEIFDTKQKDIRVKKVQNSYNPYSDVVNKKGLYSHVKNDRDEHLVNKISHRPDPGYNEYVNLIVSNQLAQSNPHFPRIYVANTFKNYTSTENKQHWKMEKLHSTLEDYFNNDDEDAKVLINYYLKSKAQTVFYRKNARPDGTLFNYSATAFADALTNPMYLADTPFKEAMKIVLKHAKEKNLYVDLHSLNFMIRLGNYIPQIVIIDPYTRY